MGTHFLGRSRDGLFHRWFSRESLMLATVLFVLLFAAWYAGSYYYLSRRGMEEAKPYRMPGFFYAPIEEVFEEKDHSRHWTLMRFYGPANFVDGTVFGGPSPVICVLWGLSGPQEEAESGQAHEKAPLGP